MAEVSLPTWNLGHLHKDLRSLIRIIDNVHKAEALFSSEKEVEKKVEKEETLNEVLSVQGDTRNHKLIK